MFHNSCQQHWQKANIQTPKYLWLSTSFGVACNVRFNRLIRSLVRYFKTGDVRVTRDLVAS
eukprot:m.248486 g.248486  ORF g.248486 m.248486 type:complete len:61 (+) comp33863_c3_seq28:5282-5464(+)